MKPDSELISLLSLVDDNDHFVRDAVRERLVARGDETIEQIERYWLPELPDDKKYIFQDYIEELKADIAFEKFESLLKSPQPQLDKGLFLITKIADISAEETIFFPALERLINELNSEVSEDKTPFENIKIFNYVFFKRFSFHHTDTHMTMEESALIDRVILSRGGNPVSITLAYFLLARAVGLPIYPLCFTGGFVPVYLTNEGQILFYLNIFKQGSIFPEDTLIQFFQDIGIEYNPDTLKIEEERALVAIYAEMLGYIFRNNGKNEVYEKMEKISDILGGVKFL